MTAVVVLAPQSAWATPRPVVITPADRVRIQTVQDPGRVPGPLRGKFVGSITDVSAGTVTILMEGGQPAVVHRKLIAGLETKVDHGSRATHSFVGGLIGAAVGAAIFAIAASSDDDQESVIDLTPGEMAPIGAIYGLPLGLLIGALLPAGKSWRAVPLESVEWKPAPQAPMAPWK
jgi:hypothetical protein